MTVTKTITTRANKPWMTAEICGLLKTRDEAFRSGDKAALKTARANLSCGIKNAKRSYALKINNHFKDSRDKRSLWKAIQTITDYKLPPHAGYQRTPVSCLNYYRPIALTPVIMKCFERLVMHNIKNNLPNTLDPLQFAYCPNRSTDDAISSTLHLALTHLENKDLYVRMLFIDFSSAFNTIIPQQLINKLNLLGLNNSLCNWILDFLTRRPQSVRVGHNTWSTTTLSTGTPQGCVLSPLLFTLLTHDYTSKFNSIHIIKFAYDTSVVGFISNNDETEYREEVAQLAEWCGANNLSLNVGKPKDVVMDFRRNSVDHPTLTINSSTVERVSSTKFLEVHITEDLTWTTNIMSISKKAQQRLH